jgi:undecaprenyl-diphosphatase
VVCFVLATLIGAVAVHYGPVRTDELPLDVALSQGRPALLVGIAQVVSALAGTKAAPLILAVVCLVVWFRDRWNAVAIGALSVVGWFSVVLAKVFFHRARPAAGVVHALVVETAHDSFASGHAAFAAALTLAALVVGRARGWSARTMWLVGVLGGLATLAVAWARLYLGAHYLADVLAAPIYTIGGIGLAIALYGVFAPWLTARLEERRSGAPRRAIEA